MIDFQFLKTKALPITKSKRWLEHVADEEHKTIGNISFVFCTDEYLLEKNIQFLKQETLTDVIAFDYSDKNKISGDILISIDRVKENAKIFEDTFLNELNRVMVHGLLHLLGYKDKTKKNANEMRKKEDYYLSKI